MKILFWIACCFAAFSVVQCTVESKEVKGKMEAECKAVGGTLRGTTCVNFSKG